MSSISSLQGVASNLKSSQSTNLLDNITDDSLSALTGSSGSFSDLLSKTQSVTSAVEAVNSAANVATAVTETAEKLSLTSDNVSGNLNTLQDDLLSNLLGYNSGLSALSSTEGSTVEAFSLDSAKQAFQSGLLGTLQANDVVETVVEEEVPVEVSALESLANFAFNEDGLGLEDVFDTFNLLQHIPVVSSVYQSATEQEGIGAVAQLAGGLLFGGTASLAYSALDLAVESYSGTSISDAISDFDYGDFFLGGVDPEVESAVSTLAKAATSDDQTLFFDKDKNLLFGR